ncbi:MAG: efflux transporter outer membrane subunit [Tepidisphaeraceae bacterium]
MKSLASVKWSVAFLSAALVGGCTVGPDYRQPETAVPDAFPSAAEEPSTRPASTRAASAQPTTQVVSTTQPAMTAQSPWWTTFEDPALDRLIEQAARANLDLRAAEARVREARAARGVVSADFWPTVDGGGSYTRSKGSENFGSSGGFVGPGGGSSFGGGESDLWDARFDALWELDVFGRTRRGVQSADANIQSTIADRNDVLLSLLAEVARNYVELRGFQRQVAIALDNVKSQQDTLELTQAKFNAGLTSDLDVARAEAQVESTTSTIPTLQTRAQQAIHRLSVLLGQPPASLTEQLAEPGQIPSPPPQIPVGLPSELLRRRPDIRRAERNLAAATARIGVATADLFPKFTISGALGLQSDSFNDWGDISSSFWSIGPGVSVPIFNAGRLRSNVAVERARTDQALAAYEQAVLVSLEEVENALVAYRKEYVRRASLSRAVTANQRAVSLSQQLYQRGLSTFLDVLDAQRALYLTQDDLVRSDALVSSNAVALFKALGGGWDAEQVAPQQARK